MFGSNRVMVADMQMLFAALMFGVGFVGQKEVMVEGMGPMTCNALRFALSTVFLAILIPFMPHNVVYSNLHAVADDLAAATAMAASFDEEGGPNKHAADAQHRSVSNVTLNFKIESVRVGAGDGVAGVGHEGEVGDDFILEQLLGRRIAQNGCCGIKRTVFLWGSFLGLLNFCVSGLQQWGLVYTSASKVAFIAGFDIILTPLLLLVMPSVKLFGQPTASTWFSVFIGLAGEAQVSI